MVDLDFFKHINDKFGHQAGDRMLKDIVDIIRAQVRESDLIVRYGGEEFLLILLDIEESSGFKVAEKIRSAVEAHHFQLSEGSVVRKTVSIGVADFPRDTASMYQAIKFADLALYEAKEAGRNKVMRYEARMWMQGDAVNGTVWEPGERDRDALPPVTPH